MRANTMAGVNVLLLVAIFTGIADQSTAAIDDASLHQLIADWHSTQPQSTAYTDLFHLAASWQTEPATPTPTPSATPVDLDTETPTPTPTATSPAITSTPTPTASPTSAPGSVNEALSILLGYNAGPAIDGVRRDAIILAVEAVRYATLVTGSQTVVSTGTLTQTAPGSINFTYAATPTDRMKVVYADGSIEEYYIDTMLGQIIDGGQAFIDSPHEVRLRAVKVGVRDMEHYDLNNNGVIQGTTVGMLTAYTIPAQVNVTIAGTTGTTGNVDLEVHTRTTGTVTSANFSLNVDDRRDFSMIANVFSSDNLINSNWTLDGVPYAYNNATILRTFSDGSPSEDARWENSTGVVTRNGQAIGQIVFLGRLGFYGFWFRFADLREIELEKYPIGG